MRIEDLTVEVRDPNLDRIGVITPKNLVGATFVARFNNVGSWSIQLPYDEPLGELLRQPGYGLILTGPDSQVILSGPTLTARLEQTPTNTDGDWLIEGVTDSVLLSERLAYPTPSTADVTAQTSGFDIRTGAAETVIKEYVNVNLGPGAATGREVTGLTVETDEARGSTVFANARFDQIQELIYNLAQVGGIGYQLKQINGNLVFLVFEPVDRSDTIRMDIQNRKLSSAIYSYGTAKVTRAIVAGRGEAENRIFTERSNTDSLEAESVWNRRIERFIDARQSEDLDELNTAGDEALADEGKTIVEMSVTPSDDQTMVYGTDWFLGDKVTVVANEVEAQAVVTEVGIQISDDGVRIGATVGTPVGIEFEAKLLAKVNQQDARISHLEKTAEAKSEFNLDDLDDVDIDSPTDGQILTYNDSSDTWENSDPFTLIVENSDYTPDAGSSGTQPVFSGPGISGRYNRIGNIVHFNIQVDFDNITNFGSGQYYVGLPFTAKSANMFRDGCLHDVSENREYHISGHVDADSDVLQLFTTDRENNRIYDFPFSQGEPVTLTTADNFHIAGTYEIEG